MAFAQSEALRILNRATLDSINAPIAVTDKRGKILRVNEPWRRFGADNEAPLDVREGIGLDYLAACRTAAEQGSEDSVRCLAGLEALLAGEIDIFEMDYACDSPTERRYFLLRAVPLEIPEGGLVISHINVTERKRSEETVRRQHAELAHLQRIAAMGELAAALAHEIKQPLTAILSNAQAAKSYLDAPTPHLDEIGEILDDIIADDRRAAEVINRVQTLLRKQAVSTIPLSINAVAGEVADLLHSDAMMRNVTIKLDLAEGLPPVRGDRVQLQQVFLNLVINSFEAMETCTHPERVVVIGTAQEADSFVRVDVRDAGPGLDGEGVEVLFEAFKTTKPEGMGMGLAISRSIIEAHGGTIWAEHNVDRGATFHFTMPADVGIA